MTFHSERQELRVALEARGQGLHDVLRFRGFEGASSSTCPLFRPINEFSPSNFPEMPSIAEETMSRKLNVLLVGDSRTVFAQLEHILNEIDDISIVGLARNGARAIRMATESRPDLVLMDVVMPGLDGLSALRTIKSIHSEMEVAMVCSVSGDVQKAEEAFRLGACDVLRKPLRAEEIDALIADTRKTLAKREGGQR